MTDLLPCPFCGSHAETDFIEGESYIIECHDCDARTGHQDCEEDAITAWNRRAGTSFQAGVLHGIRMSIIQIIPQNFNIEEIPLFPRRNYFYNCGIKRSINALENFKRSTANENRKIEG